MNTTKQMKKTLAVHNPLNLHLIESPHAIAVALACMTVNDANFELIVSEDGVFVSYNNGEPEPVTSPLVFEFLILMLIRTQSAIVSDEGLTEALVLLKYWRFLSDFNEENSDDINYSNVVDFLRRPADFQWEVTWK